MDDCLEGSKTTKAHLIFEYQGKQYEFDFDFGAEITEEVAEFLFDEGNYSCDCNRSLFIRADCDNSFPELPCGDDIEMISMNIIK